MAFCSVTSRYSIVQIYSVLLESVTVLLKVLVWQSDHAFALFDVIKVFAAKNV